MMKSLHDQLMEICNRKQKLSTDQINQINTLLGDTIAGAFLYDAILIPTDNFRDLPHSMKGYIFHDLKKRFKDGEVMRTSTTMSRRIVNHDFSIIKTKNTVYLVINPNETTQG